MGPKKAQAQPKQDANAPFVRPQYVLEFSRRGAATSVGVHECDTAQPVEVETRPSSSSDADAVVVVARLVFELATDLTPKVCENFKQLCAGALVGDKKGKDARTACYNGTRVNRVTAHAIQAGDVTHREDSKGTDNIYGTTFDDEALGAVKHSFGTLSMVNSGPNSNGCQFFVCTLTDPAPHLDARYNAFGTLVSDPGQLRALHSELLRYFSDDVLPAAGAAGERLHGRLPATCPYFISSCRPADKPSTAA